MAKQRDRLCPVWLSALLGAGITLALAVSFPTEESLSRRVATSPPSDLSVAYLEGLLRVRPDTPMYLNALAMQHIKLGQWDDAFHIADRLYGIEDNEAARRQALLLQTVATEQAAYDVAQADPQSAQVQDRVRAALEKALEYSWDVETLAILADKAREVGANHIVERLYGKLAEVDAAHAQGWHEKLAEAALSRHGEIEAAKAYMAAFQASTSRDKQRYFFFIALNTLVAANQVEQACELGHASLGNLQTDRVALRYMLTLARQAGRGDLVAYYARALLQSIPKTPPSNLIARSPVMYSVGTGVYAQGAVGIHPMLAMAAPTAVESNELPSEYELVYDAFVETGLLAEAEEAALQALEAGEAVGEWAPRLAELAMWRNHKDKGLEYWLMAAKADNDVHAWEQVLELAPELEQPDAYMQAWRFLHADQTGPDATWKAQEDLLARYVELTRWDSALALADGLVEDAPEQVKPRVVLLRVAAAEQIVYQHQADDPQRHAAMQVFRQRLEDAAHYDAWDVPTLTWLTQRAEAAAADELQERWFKTLAQVDGDNALQWQANIAKAALQRGDYVRAAEAYFTAQAMAQSRAEKRDYFIAGLQAHLASGNVSEACDAAERHRQELAGDPESLRYLIGLARQAGRADLLAAYARELIQATQNRSGQASGNEGVKPVSLYDGHTLSADGWQMHPAVWTGGEVPVWSTMQWSDIQPIRVLVSEPGGVLPDDSADQLESDLDLAFHALLQSRELDEAERTAELALEQGMGRLVWLPRLAQVSEWNGKTEKALHYWLRYAHESGEQTAWEKVAVMARQTNNDTAYLSAAQHAFTRNPSDPALLADLVATYERLGHSEQGLRYLQGYAHGNQRQRVLEEYAALADRSGRDDLALATYGQLMSEYPDEPRYAMHMGSIHQRLGNKQDALEVLRQARDHAGAYPEHAPYWQLYASLARNLRLDDEAHFAHRQLVSSGGATADDLRDLTFFYEDYPMDAGRLAEAEFRKNGATTALQFAMHFYSQSPAWRRVGVLLADLTPEQRAELERSPDSLVARATYRIRMGDYDGAFDDMRKAAGLPNAADRARVAYLWALAAFGSTPELRTALMAFRPHAENNPLYWGPLAAAELRLGNAAAASQYLRREAKRSGQHPVVLAALADAEESAGRPGVAQKLRLQAWKDLQDDPSDTASNQTESFQRGLADAEGRRFTAASLSSSFSLGDHQKAMVFQLLAEDLAANSGQSIQGSMLGDVPGLPPADAAMQFDDAGDARRSDVVGASPVTDTVQVKALLLHWSLAGQHNEFAREWLAREYDVNNPSRIDAEAYLAAESRNVGVLEDLVESDRLSLQAKLSALVAMNRVPEAQPIAYELAQAAPDNDERHTQMAELLMRTPQAVGVDVAHVSMSPLEYVATGIDGRMNLTSRFSIDVAALNRHQKTTDESELAWVPSDDRSFNLTLTDLTATRELALTVGHRDALESFHTISFMARLNPFGNFRPQIYVGRNQPTYVSQTLQVGGVKDAVRIALDWSPESPWFMHASAEAHRLYSQDRDRLGHGYVFNTEMGWRLPALLPDLHVRGVFERGVFSARDTLAPGFSRLMADGQAPLSSFIMPQNYTRYGVIVGFGVADQYSYGASWRPYADLGAIHDSLQGWGPLVAIGVSGPVIGQDRLSLFFQYEDATGDGTRSSRQFGLNYRFFF